MQLDPVTLALVQNRLDHISVQMGQSMTRTAHSPIFNQSHDFSCFITDHQGRLISQADGIPIHTGGGDLVVQALLDAFTQILATGVQKSHHHPTVVHPHGPKRPWQCVFFC